MYRVVIMPNRTTSVDTSPTRAPRTLNPNLGGGGVQRHSVVDRTTSDDGGTTSAGGSPNLDAVCVGLQ